MPLKDLRPTLSGMHPVVNIDEKIGKTVGRRKIKDSLVYGLGLQKSLARIREEAGFPVFPRVFSNSAPLKRPMHG